MLSFLAIRNVVLIKALDLQFSPGLTVLTGETGAGKSILLDALGLALGSRADFGLMGNSADSAEVTAIFAPPSGHPVWHRLSVAGIEHDGNIIMRRRLLTGKSVAMVNDTPVGLGTMREIGDMLVEIQGQFEGRGLLDATMHRVLLDRFAGHDDLLAGVAERWRNWQDASRAWQDAEAEQKKQRDEEEWLRDAVRRLDELAPVEGEENALGQERDLLANAGKVAETLQQIDALLHGEHGASEMVARAGREAGRLEDIIGAPAHELSAALARAGVELDEAGQALGSMEAGLNADPNRLTSIDDRLHELRRQAHKHDVDVSELVALHDRLRLRLTTLEDAGDEIGKLKTATEQANEAYREAVLKLSHSRREAATRLDQQVLAELPPLKLAGAQFRTKIEALAESEYNTHGGERIRFEAATNPAMELAGIDRIASGGELARFLLALKLTLADVMPPMTLIFDEVDAGVGGAVATAIGDRLARLGETLQTLVVTHSPQVAACGDQHYRIVKAVRSDGAVSMTAMLTNEERVDEISRMLAGKVVTSEARAAALKLLEGQNERQAR